MVRRCGSSVQIFARTAQNPQGGGGATEAGGSAQTVRRQALVQGPGGLGDRLQLVRQLREGALAPRRAEARGALDGVVPGRRPDPVASRAGRGARSAWPRRTGCRAPRRAPKASRRDRRARPPTRSPAGLSRGGRLRARTARPARRCRYRRASAPPASRRRRRARRRGRGSGRRCGRSAIQSRPNAGQHVVGHVLVVDDRLAVRRRAEKALRPPRANRSAARPITSSRIGMVEAGLRRDRRRRRARRRPPCPGGSRRRASSRSRCCAGPTTWRSGPAPSPRRLVVLQPLVERPAIAP